MKQSLKFQLSFLFFVAFFLFTALPLQSQTRTTAEINRDINIVEENIDNCKGKIVEIEEEMEQMGGPDTALFREREKLFLKQWNYILKCSELHGKLKELKEELDSLANPGPGIVIPEKERKKIEELQAKLDELIERNETLQKNKAELEARIKKLEEDYEKAKIGMLTDPQAKKELVEALMTALGFDVSNVTEGDRQDFYNVFINSVNPHNASEEYRGAFTVNSKNTELMKGEIIGVSLVIIEGVLHLLLNKPDIFRIGIVPIDGCYRLLRGMLEFLKNR